MTSAIQAELGEEELAWDDDVFIAMEEPREMKEDAMVGDVIDSVLEAVVTIGKKPVQVDPVDTIRKKSFPTIGPYLSATKDEEWLDAMLLTLEELEAEYAHHPFPYEGVDGCLHSADVHPPHVDFSALGFNSRRLPRPEHYPVHGCSPSSGLYQSESFPFGAVSGLLTNSGVIQVPQQLFGFEYVSGTVGRNTTWMMCAT